MKVSNRLTYDQFERVVKEKLGYTMLQFADEHLQYDDLIELVDSGSITVVIGDRTFELSLSVDQVFY